MTGPRVHANVKYSVASWEEAGRGNHRALIRVSAKADAVRAHIEWRRRDHDSQDKAILVFDQTTGERITNVLALSVNRISGDIAFQPRTIPGVYEVYYLPYTPGRSMNEAPGEYFPSENTADPAWVARNDIAARWKALPRAELIEIQARNEFNRMDPMEVIASAEEIQGLLDRFPAAYLLFPEDRRDPIRMPDDLPLKWMLSGPQDSFTGHAQPGEYYAYQIGVYAARMHIDDVTVTFSDLVTEDRKKISASAVKCHSLGGVDWLGREFRRPFEVGKGIVRPLWIGVQVPSDASGVYRGYVSVRPKGRKPSTISIQLQVSGPYLADAGDSEPRRHSRLRWLDDSAGIEETVVPPYIPVKARGTAVEILDRRITFGRDGLPASIVSRGREILASPIRLRIETPAGAVPWMPTRSRTVSSSEAAVCRRSGAVAGDLTITTTSKTEFDGCITIVVSLVPQADIEIDDIALEVALRRTVAKYAMGMGARGGYRPARIDWRWARTKLDRPLWLGDANAGLQLHLRDLEDSWPDWPYAEHPVPAAWDNHGQGGCSVSEDSETVMVRAYTARRTLTAGERLDFKFRLLVTPFRRISKAHWNLRVMAEGSDIGGNIVHIHHGNRCNPYINYPFIVPKRLAAVVKRERSRGVGVNLYYTVRELSNHATELWALRSLGDEVLIANGVDIFADRDVPRPPGEGYAWLKEHLVTGYLPEWRTAIDGGETDAAIATEGLSRWHNYYVRGLDWLMTETGVDGLYLDGIGYDREVMKRVTRVMAKNNPNYRIDLHEANLYDVMDLKVSPANEYMEHLPYVTGLWFGEFYEYNNRERGPDYWLVELSGIPFGLGGDMLDYHSDNRLWKGNPWRAMVFGMTGRRNPSGPAMWRFWDDFGIADAEWIGYWEDSCPVTTDNPDVKATVYRKQGRALIALGSWAPADVAVRLSIDWQALGLDPATARLTAPPVENFQDARVFAVDESIPVQEGKGWLLLIHPRQDLRAQTKGQ